MKKLYFNCLIILFVIFSSKINSAPIPSGSGAGEMITIKSGSKKLCLYGQSYRGVYYASVDWESFDNCAKRTAPKFIFAVTGQIMAKIYSKWWCLTAPSTPSVTSSYDYVQLKPCSIFDPYQEWRYDATTNGLKTAKDGYELRERNWGLAISSDPGKLNKFEFTFPNFSTWIKDDTKLKSGITFPLPISWKYKDIEYYLSRTSYYNPETKKIFMVNPDNPAQWLCLRSWQTKKPGSNWDWVDFIDCDSDSQIDELSWEVDTFTPKSKDFNGVMISDKNGNILRVTNTGSKWGTPYTVTLNYAKSDTSNSPNSIFRTSSHLKNYLQLESANLGKTLSYCPAPGDKKNSIQITPRSLPSNFDINQWWNRIYAVVRQPGDDNSGIGACGTCFIQAVELIREFYLYRDAPPTSNQPGILFPIDRQTDLIQYVRNNDSRRYQRALRLSQRYRANMLTDSQWEARQQAALTQASAELFLPNYDITTTSTDLIPQGMDPTSETTRRELFEGLVSGFNSSPVNSVWVLTYTVLDRLRTEHGHAVLMVRTNLGLQILDANIYRPRGQTISLENYRAQSRNIIRTGRNLEDSLLRYIGASQLGVQTLRLLDAHRVDERSQGPGGPLSVTTSFGNCENSTSSTGASTGGFGSGATPSGNDINQCSSSSGKCYLQ